MPPFVHSFHIVIVLSLMTITLQYEAGEHKRLLVLLLDGFRWDYINKRNLPGFNRLRNSGGHVKRIVPVFPADCFPNIYTIFTGVYPSVHGMIANKVYDQEKRVYLDNEDSQNHGSAHLWLDYEPIWTTAKKNRLKTFLYHVPVCSSHLSSDEPDHCVPYHTDGMTSEGFSKAVNSAFDVLSMDATNMAVVYNDRLDSLAHKFGPESYSLETDLIPELDKSISNILDRIEAHSQPISLMILSDHGMSQMSESRAIFLDRMIIRSELDQVINNGIHASLWPKKNKLKKVLSRLVDSREDIDVYEKENIPKEWQIKEHSRVPPILVVAKPGFFLQSRELKSSKYHNQMGTSGGGWHGYTPEATDMHTPFFYYGQDVKPEAELESLSVVEIYQLMCSALGFSPPSTHNGTWSHVDPLLKSHVDKPSLGVATLSPPTHMGNPRHHEALKVTNTALTLTTMSNTLSTLVLTLLGLFVFRIANL